MKALFGRKMVDIEELRAATRNAKKEGFVGLVDSKLTNDQKESLKKLNI